MKNQHEWWLAACVYFEARGEPFQGQVAVVQVVLNRVIRRGISVIDVIQQSKQFSWHNGGTTPAIHNWTAFIRCMDAVDCAIYERYNGDTLQGADHYHADHITPYWADSMTRIDKIGKHIFYRS